MMSLALFHQFLAYNQMIFIFYLLVLIATKRQGNVFKLCHISLIRVHSASVKLLFCSVYKMEQYLSEYNLVLIYRMHEVLSTGEYLSI